MSFLWLNMFGQCLGSGIISKSASDRRTVAPSSATRATTTISKSSSSSRAVSNLISKITYDERVCVALDATHDSHMSFDRFKMLLLLLQHQEQHQQQADDDEAAPLPLIHPTCFEGHAMQVGSVSNQVFTCGVCRHRKPAQCRSHGCLTCELDVCFSCQRALEQYTTTDRPAPLTKLASLRVRRAVLSSMIQHRLGSPTSFAMRTRVGHDFTQRWADQAFIGHRTMLALIKADPAALPSDALIVVLCRGALSPRSKFLYSLPMELVRELYDMLGAQAGWFPVLQDTYA